MNTVSDDELLFFGSLVTNLAYHAGSVHCSHFDSTNELQFQIPKNELTVHSMASKLGSSVGTDYDQVVLPNLPINSIQIPTTPDNEQTISDDFCRPLIKYLIGLK